MSEDISCARCLVVGVEGLEEVVYRFVEDKQHYSMLLKSFIAFLPNGL